MGRELSTLVLWTAAAAGGTDGRARTRADPQIAVAEVVWTYKWRRPNAFLPAKPSPLHWDSSAPVVGAVRLRHLGLTQGRCQHQCQGDLPEGHGPERTVWVPETDRPRRHLPSKVRGNVGFHTVGHEGNAGHFPVRMPAMRPCVRDVLSAVACAPGSATLSSRRMEGLRSEAISNTPARSRIHSPLCNARTSPPLCAPSGAMSATGHDLEWRTSSPTHVRRTQGRASTLAAGLCSFSQGAPLRERLTDVPGNLKVLLQTGRAILGSKPLRQSGSISRRRISVATSPDENDSCIAVCALSQAS